MAALLTVKFTANFERNLADIEAFLRQMEAPQAFDDLVDELVEVVVPNLERFPGLGRLFLQRQVRSAEGAHSVDLLTRQLQAIAPEGEIREYVMTHYLVLYARIKKTVHLLSIRNQRQLSFDFEGHWAES